MAINFWEQIDLLASQKILNIVLIAHVREPRGYINTTQLQCTETERFSVEEFNEIYQGIVNAGYFVQSIYFNEIDFINDYFEHPDRYRNSLVFTLARNGLGDNKKTLIPSFCEMLGLRYTTSPSLSCAMARNKYYFSTLLNSHNVPVPQSWLHTDNGKWLNGSPAYGKRVICKPSSESASQGIDASMVTQYSSETKRILTNKNYIVQEYIEGYECEVPIFKVADAVYVFPPVGINLGDNKILDAYASEHNQYSFYKLDAHFPPEVISNIQAIAEKAFRLLQMDIYGRIDFRITPDGRPYIFDVSTTPYTTKHSSFAYAFQQLGFEYSDIYRAIISAALMRKTGAN